jgi:hypothetical protein
MSDYSAASQGSLLRPALLMGKTRGNKAARHATCENLSLVGERDAFTSLRRVSRSAPDANFVNTTRESERAGGGGIIIYFVR